MDRDHLAAALLVLSTATLAATAGGLQPATVALAVVLLVCPFAVLVTAWDMNRGTRAGGSDRT